MTAAARSSTAPTSSGVRLAGGLRIAALGAFLVACLLLTLPDIWRAAWVLANGVAGGILVVRRPRNVIGYLLLVVAFSFSGTNDLSAAEVAAMQAGAVTGLDAFKIWLGGQSGVWAFLAYGVLGLVFPTGRLPGVRWRIVARALIAVGVLVAALSLVSPWLGVTIAGGSATVIVPNPYAVAPTSGLWGLMPDGDTAFIAILAVLAAGVASIVVRAIRSTGVVRLQMRWLAASLACVVAGVLIGAVAIILGGPLGQQFGWYPASLAFLTVPAAVTAAVLRHRLLDIDRIVSRTIGWALASGVLAGLFLLAVAGLQALLVDVNQGETVAVAASTLLAVACFQPVRSRLQRVVDRRFDRAAYDRDRLVASFGGRLRDELDLATVQRELVATAVDTVRPVATGVWVRASGTRGR
jgi:hypothetical protein